MTQICSRCSRANPPEASFCYYDGIGLPGHSQASSATQVRFSVPIIFDSGAKCSNFEELATTILVEWEAAQKMLKSGAFTKFFSSIGRLDLSAIAAQSANFPAPGQGLDSFLGKLPVQNLMPAKLDVEPEMLDAGILKVGQDKKVPIKIRNLGRRLLFGTVSIEGAGWLNIGDGVPKSRHRFEAFQDAVLPLYVKGKLLRASEKPLSGRLVFETSGGTIVVPLKAMVPVKPFSGGVLAGAKTPREIALKAKASPQEAVNLFETLQVQKWYSENGWEYPVPGPSASGLAAIQQFFEALGLAKPPRVTIGSTHIVFDLNPGEVREQVLPLFGDDKKPVYANVSVMVPWIEVYRVEMRGNRVNVYIRVHESRMSGSSQSAFVSIQANGGQNFKVRIDARKKRSFEEGSDSLPVSAMQAYLSDDDSEGEDSQGILPPPIQTRSTMAPGFNSDSKIQTRISPITWAVIGFLVISLLGFMTALSLLLVKKAKNKID